MKKSNIKLSSVDLKNTKKDNINSSQKSKVQNQISMKMIDYMTF